MEQAEKIVKEQTPYNKIAVISGIELENIIVN